MSISSPRHLFRLESYQKKELESDQRRRKEEAERRKGEGGGDTKKDE
jgi:hypothetical protein